MFDLNQLAADRSASPPASPPSLENKEMLATIIARLEKEVPDKSYLPDRWLAEALNIEPKTLMNRRSENPGRYPRPMHFAGSQLGSHVRSELILWLARQELQAKTSRVHTCT